MEKFEIDKALYDAICKQIIKARKEYNVLSEKNVKLEVENKFLNKEVKALKAENIKLLKFQEKKEKVSNRIKKVLSKLESLKVNNG